MLRHPAFSGIPNKGGGSKNWLPHSPVLWQFALSEILSRLRPEGAVLWHSLDDFLLVGVDVDLPRAVMRRVAEELKRCGIIGVWQRS